RAGPPAVVGPEAHGGRERDGDGRQRPRGAGPRRPHARGLAAGHRAGRPRHRHNGPRHRRGRGPRPRTRAGRCGVTVILAVDLGGTKTALARVTEDGQAADVVHLPAARTLEASVAQVAGAAHDAAAVGIIVPGIYDPAAGTAWCPNLW